MRGTILKHSIFATGVSRLASVAAGVALLALAVPASAVPAADTDLIARGAYLAKAADCIACHTAARGKPFAGGLPMNTPMGRIYSTNITPDNDTGIGRYSEADFAAAMRKGVAKDGHNLYPAMPYPSYARTSDADVHALYAYFMHGVQPVSQPNREPDISWPLNMRWPLKFWNLLFVDDTPYQDVPGKDAQWNRGAYLVQTLGHCGACHTARGVAFQEKALDERGAAFLGGAPLDGWFASNLTGDSNTGLGRWSEEDVALFLKIGANGHATAFGPMTDVINHSTQYLSDADRAAMARYLKSLGPTRGASDGAPYDGSMTGATQHAMAGGQLGAATYATYCLHCHGVTGQGYAPLLAPLAGNPNAMEKDPSSLINVVLNGTGALKIQGVPAPYPMPSYRGTFSDQEVADVVTYIRHSWGNGQMEPVSAGRVRSLRDASQ